MKKIIILIILTSITLVTTNLYAANYYVTPGGAGLANGSDWSNALPWTFTPTRGDGTNVYYIAGGSYSGAKTFSTGASGSAIITLRKATTANSSGVAGWSSSFNNQAVFSGEINFSSSYWLLDGVTGSGRSGYGFHTIPANGANSHAISINAQNYITVQYTEMSGAVPIVDNNCIDNVACPQYGFYAIGYPDHITLAHSWDHDFGADLVQFNGGTNITISDNIIERNSYTPTHHSCVITFNTSGSSVTIKNNIMDDFTAVATICFLNPTAPFSGYDIYDNVMYITGTYSIGTGPESGIVGCRNSGTCNNFDIYSNTIVNLETSANLDESQGTISNWNVHNNLWFCNSGPCGTALNDTNAAIIYNKNWYGGVTYNVSEAGAINGGSVNPFTNSATYDFGLAAGITIDAGAILIRPNPPVSPYIVR